MNKVEHFLLSFICSAADEAYHEGRSLPNHWNLWQFQIYVYLGSEYDWSAMEVFNRTPPPYHTYTVLA